MISDTLTSFFVIASRRHGNPVESQNAKWRDEGLCFLNCNFDF